MKVAEALPGIIGVILSWILNKASNIAGCLSQNLWALVAGVIDVLYIYIYGYQEVRIFLQCVVT